MNNEQKKLMQLIVAFVAVIALGVIGWKLNIFKPNVSQSSLIAYSAANPASADSAAKTAPAKFDFGEISMAKGNASTSFILENTTEEPLVITGVETSCMCTTAQIDGKSFGMSSHGDTSSYITVPPKGVKEMTVIFDPNAHGPEAVGPITRQIAIHTNSASTPHIEVLVSGNVVK